MIDLYVKPKYIKLLEEKRGENFYNLGLGKDILAIILENMLKEGKTVRLEFYNPLKKTS